MADYVRSGIQKMMHNIEMDMYLGQWQRPHIRGLLYLLTKLSIKSAKEYRPGLIVEGLDATLSQVTFNSDHLNLWKAP